MSDPTKFQALEFHPIAAAFPMLEAAALKELADDIREHGLHEPIIRHQGKVLDGRNRYLAAQTAGVEPRFVEFDGDDAQAINLVVSRNLLRRHLDDSQRASAAAKIATMRQGERTDLSPSGGKKSQAEAAKMMNVSKRSVERAVIVHKHGTPELIEALDAGIVPVSTAADLAREPVETQREIIKTAQIETTTGVARLSMPERLEPKAKKASTKKTTYVPVPPLPATSKGFTTKLSKSKPKSKAKSKSTAPSPSPFAAVIGELEGTVDWFALPEWKAALDSKLTEAERQRMIKAVNAISRHIEAAVTALTKSKLH